MRQVMQFISPWISILVIIALVTVAFTFLGSNQEVVSKNISDVMYVAKLIGSAVGFFCGAGIKHGFNN